MSTFPATQIAVATQYLVLIEPREDISNLIMSVANRFHQKYKTTNSIGAKPGIPIVRFVQHNGFESRIRQRLRAVAQQSAPIKIDLKDFGALPSHTIYLNVLTKPALQDLAKAIRTNAQSLMTSGRDSKPHFISEPTIIIANKLKPWQYEKGWLELSHKSFTGTFIANSMNLMAKEPEAKSFRLVETFEFKSMGMRTKQASLF